jgi:hypothetical protein
MTGHRPFRDLRNKMSPERRESNEAATKAMLQEMALHELRQARAKTQQDVARALQVNQPAVAKLEQRADIYVSNLRRYIDLRRYIEALGGTLEITARFPDASVSIKNFSELAADK